MVENESESESRGSESKDIEKEKIKGSKNETIIVSQPSLANTLSPYECLKFNSFATLATPSPNFISPIPYLGYNQIFPTYGYFQCYMNDFYNHLSGSSSTNHQWGVGRFTNMTLWYYLNYISHLIKVNKTVK